MPILTDKLLRGLKPTGKPYEERDTLLPGLLIRVGKRNKVFEYVQSINGHRRRRRIGVYPDCSLAMARRFANDLRSSPAVYVHSVKVAELWEIYAAEKRGIRRAFRDVESAWRIWVEPAIGNLRVEDVGLRHGADIVSRVAASSSPHRARQVIRYISPMFKFAVGRGLIQINPWTGISLPDAVPARERVLTESEWLALWQWACAAPYPFGGFLRALMLSAQRKRDISALRWSELEGDLIALPGGRHKSGRRHELPMSRKLAEIIAEQPKHDEFVFSTRPGAPIWPGSKLSERIQRETGTANWRFHDIRRTGATLISEAGVPRFVIERLLGHADRSVTAIYDRHSYRAEKRQALEVLAATVGPLERQDSGPAPESPAAMVWA